MSGDSQKGSTAERADVTVLCSGKPDTGLLDHSAQPFPLADEEPREKKLI